MSPNDNDQIRNPKKTSRTLQWPLRVACFREKVSPHLVKMYRCPSNSIVAPTSSRSRCCLLMGLRVAHCADAASPWVGDAGGRRHRWIPLAVDPHQNMSLAMGNRCALEKNAIARRHARQDMLLLCVGSPHPPDDFLADAILRRSLSSISHAYFVGVTRTREFLRTQVDVYHKYYTYML